MVSDPTPARKRQRTNEDEVDEVLERGWTSRKIYDSTTARDQSRQHNGDNINIFHGAATVAGASTLPELDLAKDALERLYFDEMDARYLTINASLAPSSCSWLFGRPEYQRWQDVGVVSEHHGFLWIKGKAGAGKSTLMKYLFDKAEKIQLAGQTVVSFFFNARGAPIERSLEGMYRALLHQIFHKLPRLCSLLTKKRALSAQSQDWSLDRLQCVFRDVVESLDSEQLTCYIDALDECTEDEVEDMVSLFEDLGEHSAAQGTQFQVCFASRHYPHISIDRSESLILEDQDGHKEDISSYVKKKLKISNKVLKTEMSQLIEGRASGVFLWVVLVVSILNDECKRGNVQLVRTRLKEIPIALTDLIQDILQRDKPTIYLVPLLQWILYSRRPLSREELFLALQSIDAETLRDSHTPEALTRDNIDKFILNTSKGLAEMTKGKTPRVQFIHELVRTHFLGAEGLVKLEPALKLNLVGQSHDQLKRCCYNYLISEACAQIILPAELPRADSQEGKTLRNQTLSTLPFLEYTLENILYHANSAHDQGIAQHGFVSFFPLFSWRILDNAVARYTSHRHHKTVSTAYILAEQGRAALLKIAMVLQPQADAPYERCQSLLGAAVDARSIKSVQAVLARKGYEHSLGKAKGSCITHAIENDDLEIVQELVKAKARPYNDKTVLRRHFEAPKNNALMIAASQPEKFGSSLGHFGLLRLLLGSLSPLDLENKSYAIALGTMASELCRYGTEEILDLVRTKGVEINGSMLVDACTYGNEELVRFLLALLDVKRFDEPSRVTMTSALQNASSQGQENIVRLLLHEYAIFYDKVNGSAVDGALYLAVIYGHETVVSVLLEGGADIDRYSHWTLLGTACKKGHSAVARLLFEHGATIHSRGGNEAQDPQQKTKTPLFDAIEGDHHEIARWLIKDGVADIHYACSEGRTALWLACSLGQDHIARLLIDRGAHVNVRASCYPGSPKQTALEAAELKGHSAVVRALKEKGAC
jgi:ankyrin repeat protein